MRESLIEEFHRIKNRHWWYRGRRKVLGELMHRFIPQNLDAPILDLGCGPATNAGLVAPFPTHVVALDLSPRALEFCRVEGYGKPVAAHAQALPFADKSFALVLALDLLEHLEDDVAAIGEIRRVLAPNGLTLILVPAFKSLWGWQDDVSGHLRRYSPPLMREHITDAGFQILKLTCINSGLALPLFVARKALRLSRLPPRSENTLTPRWADSILYAAFVAEAPLVTRIDLPFGASVACIARRLG